MNPLVHLCAWKKKLKIDKTFRFSSVVAAVFYHFLPRVSGSEQGESNNVATKTAALMDKVSYHQVIIKPHYRHFTGRGESVKGGERERGGKKKEKKT